MRARLDSASEDFPFFHASEVRRFSEAELEAYAGAAFRYWRRRGFPYPNLRDHEIVAAFAALSNSATRLFLPRREVQWSPVGIRVANAFHPHMWSTKCEYFRTPMEVFQCNTMLADCIRRALKMTKHRRPLTAPNLRRGLATYRNTKRVSNFRPTVAKAFYERYSQPGDRILDPGAGYGGRLLGCLPLDRTYVGIEPSTESFRGLERMLERIAPLARIEADVRLHNSCAEDLIPTLPDASIALALWSPPYYGRERYSEEPTQSYRRYGSYGAWKEMFLGAVIGELRRVIKAGGYVVINAANTEMHPVLEDVRRVAARHFTLHYSYRMRIGRVPYHRRRNWLGHRHEKLLVYRRP